MDILENLDQLDERLAACDAAKTDAELREVFATFRMKPQLVGLDPFSPEYLESQMALYRRIAGRGYSVANEVSTFNVTAAVLRPFPYVSGSAEVVGNQLIAMGALLRRLQVPPGGRILEFGPGWGNTTLAMALCGYQVTAVDVEQNFCELIKQGAALNSVTIEVVNSDFMWAESVQEPYDAVVFFECFHHCADHMRLLRALGTAVKPEGRVYFAGEPIDSSFPMPWGLRMEGEALWAIRKHGWLELGFNDSYFAEALSSLGWDAVKHPSGDHFSANVWEARRPELFEITVPAGDGAMGTSLGVIDSKGLTVRGASEGWGFFGPYIRVPAGDWIATATFAPDPPPCGRGSIDLCHGPLAAKLVSRIVETSDFLDGRIELAFSLSEAATNVEMRFFCKEDVTFKLNQISIRPAKPGSVSTP